MGVRFTPGGLGIVVGKNSHWDRSSSTGSIAWMCLFTRYTLEDGSRLVETRLGPTRHERTRTIRVDGDHLLVERAGTTGWVYDRVHGTVPLRDGRLDVRAWEALD